MRGISLIALAACGGAVPSGAPSGPPPGMTPAAAGAPDPAPIPAGSAPAPAALPEEAQALLALHDRARAAHCAPPLAWDERLAAVAQRWADHLRDDGCGFEHSRTRYGENLAMGTTGALDAETIVGMWYGEVSAYDFRHGGFGMDTGHFTQLVWRATERLGCGRATCRGMDIVVCNYDPPGNVETEFAENVLPASCEGSR